MFFILIIHFFKFSVKLIPKQNKSDKRKKRGLKTVLLFF